MAWTAANRYLNQSEMDGNAREFYSFFASRGWSLNAICAMLGNAARESRVNPGAWQNYKVSPNLGYGIMQWTPSSKVRNWLVANGYPYESGEGQCQRILWEKANRQQYYPTQTYNISFETFSKSNDTLEYLTMAWLKNYLRAGVEAVQERLDYTNYFYKLLSGETPPDPVPNPPEEPYPPTTDPTQEENRRRRLMIIIKQKRKDGIRWYN